MMAGNNLVVAATSTWNGKGLAQAESSITRLGKTAVRYLGVTGGVAGVLNLAKSSLSAFANEQKQQAILANTLGNKGMGAYADSVNTAIENMRLATGVSADELRPAFDKLFLATGDVAKSLSALNLAMDVSKGTGKDLNMVAQALSKGYLGNTTSLTRLGAGLDKATLATGNMDLITGVLEKKLGGSAAVAANTFGGEIDILHQNVEIAKESIGKHLVDAIGKASGTDGISGMTTLVQGLTREMNSAIDATGGLVGKLNSLANSKGGDVLSKIFGFGGNLFDVIANGDLRGFAGSGSKWSGTAGAPGAAGYGGMPHPAEAGPHAMTAQQLAALKLKTDDNKKTKEQIALQKARNAIMTLSNKFDMKRIELQAVIAGTATESQKAAAKAQLDLLDAQDKMTLNTKAGSDAALKLAAAGLAQLVIKDKLAEAEAKQIAKAQLVADAAALVAGSMGSLAGYISGVTGTGGSGTPLFTPDGSLTGRGKHNIPRDTEGNSPGGTTVIVKIGEETIAKVVQKGTQQMSMAGLATGRNSDVVWS